MSTVKELQAASKKACISTYTMSRATGIPRATFHYWFKPEAAGGYNPRPYRQVQLAALLAAIRKSLATGELPGLPPAEAVKVLKKHLKAVA